MSYINFQLSEKSEKQLLEKVGAVVTMNGLKIASKAKRIEFAIETLSKFIEFADDDTFYQITGLKKKI